MKLTNKETYGFAEELLNYGTILTEFEISFVESIIKISNRPGAITLTIDQEKLYKEIDGKLLICKLKHNNS